VATRLSYAFWNSLPDGQLRRLAKDGSLLKDEVLIAEANRLLNHPNGERFVESFSDQWLELSQINFTQPDRRKFPTFDPIVQDSIVQETRAFLKELIVKDLPVSNLVVSDFAMLNTRLKYHYGLRDVDVNPGQGLQKVALRNPELGGIVTHGSIMKVTADGAVTSPVLRGVWVNERILGLEVPPPPPNVPAVEPDIRGATSIREQLAKHRSDESCAACHRKIDPAGFALERFDPVGRIREFYGRPGKSARVDASGVTPDGVEFTDYSSWKKIYADRPEQLAKAFVHHFLTYATGASPGLSDEPEIERIVHEAAKQDYGLRSLILALLQSGIFKQK